MVSLMNEYIAKIKLLADDVTKSILSASLMEQPNVAKSNILIKSNRYIVDIRLEDFSIEEAIMIMNHFMECTRYHYSAFFIRFNEGNLVRYRYASCKENKEGFYCDVIIS